MLKLLCLLITNSSARALMAWVVLGFFVGQPLFGQASENLSPAEAEAFEKEIRPLLAKHCFDCHGDKKQWSDLRLDSATALLQGGERGPAVVPGKPDDSLLIQAVRHTGDLQMPPKKKLAPTEITILENWVQQGAKWPKQSLATESARAKAWKTHWAFQPISNPSPPTVKQADWCQTPVDQFILAELEKNGLAPAPPADRRTLIRRATFDLLGLPPSPAEVQAFVADHDPQAYPKLIERLLESPHYGEQWARHWLDVARYSDTKGYVYAREERFFMQAPAYRDWVVQAFQQDLPYNQFLLLQIAADQVAPTDRPALAAMGFLTLGRRFLGVTHDIIDDRIDVITRGTMGLTASCARCHDHKFDPIPTADYYSLYGIFQNCTERPSLVSEPTVRDAAYEAFDKELKSRQQKLVEQTAKSREESSSRVRSRLADYLFAQTELHKYHEEGFDIIIAKTDLYPEFVRRWNRYLTASQQAHSPIFTPWFRFAAIPADKFSDLAPALANEILAAGPEKINPLIAQAFVIPPASLREVADRYGQVCGEVERQWKEALQAAQTAGQPLPTALPDAAAEAIRQMLYLPSSPCVVPDEEVIGTENYFDSGTCDVLWKLQGDVDRWLIQSPLSPPYALGLFDRTVLTQPKIFKRGNPATKGEEVSRHFLTLLAGPQPPTFTQGSGRLELAQAIVDPKNPLTSRVWANRIWQHHFGAGLTRTPSDFGMRADPPSHPLLLDWLAQQLLANGWSTKALHRQLMLSAAYQQSSAGPLDPAARKQLLQTDPENRLLWRFSPRRLTFEEMRDSFLVASGDLDRRAGGKASELFKDADNVRRTLYGLVDRQYLPGTFRVFDFANPDLHISQRNETTVPQQALFAVNHPFVARRARGLVKQIEQVGPLTDLPAAVQRLYSRTLQRDPSPQEQAAAAAFLENSATENLPAPSVQSKAWQYGFGEVDEPAGKLNGFAPLPHFTGTAWQGGAAWPDGKLGWVQVTAEGGHPGDDLKHASVRRWVAPAEMTVAIRSLVKHEPDVSDGIRCRIISSHAGILQTALVKHQETPVNIDSLPVQAGETIDFVVDILAELNSDQHFWSPVISDLSGKTEHTWDAAKDFVGPQPELLTPWEQLAQVLLLTNEFMFLD